MVVILEVGAGRSGPVAVAIRRGLGALLAAVLLPAAAAAQTVRVAVDCGGARLVAAERATCASPDLSRLAATVDSVTAALEGTLTGREREALVDTEAPFVRQRNDCANAGADVRGCVARLLRGRLDALSAAAASPSSILAETVRYTFVDVPYLLTWGDRLVGRRVRVWGRMTLEAGPVPADRVHGTLRAPVPGGASVPVVFKAMDPTRAVWFYDAKQPVGYWEGTVAWRAGRPALTGVEP